MGMMYGQGGAGGTSSTPGAQGQGAGGQQGKQPIGILQGAELGLMAAQAKKLEAEADNLNQDTDVKEKQSQKLAEEEQNKDYTATMSKNGKKRNISTDYANKKRNKKKRLNN